MTLKTAYIDFCHSLNSKAGKTWETSKGSLGNQEIVSCDVFSHHLDGLKCHNETYI